MKHKITDSLSDISSQLSVHFIHFVKKTYKNVSIPLHSLREMTLDARVPSGHQVLTIQFARKRDWRPSLRTLSATPLTIRHQRRAAETSHNYSIMPRIPIKILCQQTRSERNNALTRVLKLWAVVSIRREYGTGDKPSNLRRGQRR